ncbi:MAG: DUF6265 family protein [Henriciella sp.]
MKISLIPIALGLSFLNGFATAETPVWMAGCWEDADGAREVWVKEADGAMVGFGVVLGGGEIQFHEVLTIRPGEDGTLVYTAYPGGGSGTPFRLSESGNASVRFSNPDHDYPQEIAYRREAHTLEATISATGGANAQTFTKHSCE